MTFLPGHAVTYHHGMLDVDVPARVVSVKRRGVVIEFGDPANGWPNERRFLTHKQASACLSART